MKKIILLGVFIVAICYTAKAQYTDLLNFNETNGSGPESTLITDGTFLYGTTSSGGTYGKGTIFKIKTDGTGFSKLFDFNGTNGNYPTGSLISDGTYLYGITEYGGINSLGVIFKIKSDGTDYSKLLDFNGTNGSSPLGSLISDGTFLYGTTSSGGANTKGLIFKIKTNGTGYSNLFDFSYGNGPCGSLLSDGTFLYGVTSAGGTYNYGTIFKIMTNGTGYATIFDFDGSSSGQIPVGSLISDSIFLYGMTKNGGANSLGTVFKIMPDGTGFTKLLDFNSTNGSYPNGSLIYDGSCLYGMTQGDGMTSDRGVIFKIMPDSTGYSKLLDFFASTNGYFPRASLLSDGTFLYGTLFGGGTNDKGVIFKYQYSSATSIVETNSVSFFYVYPNPCNGVFQVVVGNTQGVKREMIIYNVLGIKVFESTITNLNSEIDLSDQPKGIYFIKIKVGEKNYTEKIVIQ